MSDLRTMMDELLDSDVRHLNGRARELANAVHVVLFGVKDELTRADRLHWICTCTKEAPDKDCTVHAGDPAGAYVSPVERSQLSPELLMDAVAMVDDEGLWEFDQPQWYEAVSEALKHLLSQRAERPRWPNAVCFTCEGESGLPPSKTVDVCERCYGGPDTPAPTTPPVESRSVQRRKAMQRGES